MISRILLCSLLVASPVLAAGPTAFSTPPASAVQYLTQPGATEPPPRYSAPNGVNALARLVYWNELAQRVQGYDHVLPLDASAPAYMPEQAGRTRVSRVFAIVHIAIHDVLAAICRRYPPYSGALTAYADSSRDAAIAQAAHDTLVALYPRQKARIDAWLQADLARLPDGRAKLNGIDVGRRAAAAILALRAGDGAYYGEPVVGQDYQVSLEPGQWRPDPVSQNPYAFGAYWRLCPFVMQSASQFRPPAPPALSSSAYTQAFTFVSDEHNGITRDNKGRVRPKIPRSYQTLSQAEQEGGQSRIYLGVHWQFDKTAGAAMSHRVVDSFFQRGLVPAE